MNKESLEIRVRQLACVCQKAELERTEARRNFDKVACENELLRRENAELHLERVNNRMRIQMLQAELDARC